MLAILALALTAGRASADLHCVPDLSQAGPHGELCSGNSGSHAQAQQLTVNPQAAAQLTNIAGGLLGSAVGSAFVTPLTNQYHGRAPVKPVVSDDDGIETPNVDAASDIIGSYKPQADDSYGSRLAHFRELHDAEMDLRRAALEKIRGTRAEKWCAAHIGILFPSPPVVDVLNRYPDKVRAYDREKRTWDKRCGGPSQQPGYQGFTDELAGLKPDAPASAAVAGTTTKAPKYEAAAPEAEPEKPAGDSFADAEKELEGPPAKKGTKAADAPPAAQSAPADVGAAPDSAPSPNDSKNTNHSTNFFGQPNAKVTEKDLADSRASELEDLRPGSPSAAAGSGGARWSGIPQVKEMPGATAAKDFPRSWGTPEEVAVMFAPKRPPQFPNPMDYVSRALPFLKGKAKDKAASAVKDGTKKAILAEFGGFEGRILYNMYELPEYVLQNVLRAAKGDLTLKQADWLTVGAANVLYNMGSAPNAVLAKIAQKGDAKEGMVAYGLDTASEKATDAINNVVIHDTSDAVAKGYDLAKFGDVSEKAPDGMETNMYANRMANSHVLAEEGKTALKGVAIFSALQGGQADTENSPGDQ